MTLPANMLNKIVYGHDCWTWTGAITSSGYGSVIHEGRVQSTHRLAYELLIGPIPAGMHIDHLCRNKKCCNPKHLEPVTPLENSRRYIAARYGEPQPVDPNQRRELMAIFDRFFGAST